MSIGKRRLETVPRPASPLGGHDLHQAGPPGAAARPRAARLALVVASLAGHRGDRPRLRAPVHLPARRARRPRDPGQRQGVPDPQPDQDQQRAAGRGRPGAAGDGQRPGADPRAGRSPRRPDGRDRQGRSDSRTSATPSGRPGSSGRRSSPRSRRPSPRRPRATRCTRRSPRPSGRSPATASSAPAPCRRTRNRAAPCRSARRASRGPWPAWSPRAGHPRAHGQARGAGLPGVLRGVHLAADRPGPLRPDRRQVRRHADAHLRSRGHRQGARGGPVAASPTITTPTPAATCSSSRARRSARSS